MARGTKKAGITSSGKVPRAQEPRRPAFDLEFYADGRGNEVVRTWLRGLSLRKKQVIGAAMNSVLQHLGVDVCDTQYGKQIGGGLFEFRVRQDAGSVQPGLPPEKILLRAFCHAYGSRIVLLVGGYDKGEDPSKRRQQAEIEVARERLADWKRRKAQGKA
jgi:phage-related protein